MTKDEENEAEGGFSAASLGCLMTELRREPVTRMWVAIAAERPKGPSDYLPFKQDYQPRESGEPCPFCPGNESMTPAETFSVSRKNGTGWSVRVVPNKFPFSTWRGISTGGPVGCTT